MTNCDSSYNVTVTWSLRRLSKWYFSKTLCSTSKIAVTELMATVMLVTTWYLSLKVDDNFWVLVTKKTETVINISMLSPTIFVSIIIVVKVTAFQNCRQNDRKINLDFWWFFKNRKLFLKYFSDDLDEIILRRFTATWYRVFTTIFTTLWHALSDIKIHIFIQDIHRW